ncbi:MAG: hypothetical protein WAM62_10200 [Pseudolabrys sp.]
MNEIDMTKFIDQRDENRIRSLAKRRGYRLRRSREWKNVPNLDNYGEYMLIDAAHNFIVLGERFNASLNDIEAFLGDA